MWFYANCEESEILAYLDENLGEIGENLADNLSGQIGEISVKILYGISFAK